MKKSKIYVGLLAMVLAGTSFGQAAKPATSLPTKPVEQATTPKEVTLTETETLKIQNYGLQYALVKKQSDDVTKSLTQISSDAMWYVSTVEKKYNAKYDPNSGKFFLNPSIK